jgi:spermidine synthase
MVRFTALLLTVLTGFTGLVCEVAWYEYVATLLGSRAAASAALLVIFLGGLSAGYVLFGRATDRRARRARYTGDPLHLLRFYGLVEFGIGLYALLFPWLFSGAQWLSRLLPLHAGPGFAFDGALAALLLGPPAIMMGATIPILTLALAGDLRHATRVHAWVYGLNTVGASAGVLAGGFFLVPWLGLDGAVSAMGWLNLLAGAAFLFLDLFRARVTPALDERTGSALPGAAGLASYASVAALSGFAMMTLGSVLSRIGALSLGPSDFTFAVVVAVLVLCIALGGLAVAALHSIPAWVLVGSQWLGVAMFTLLYFEVPDAPYYAHALRMLFQDEAAAFYPYQLALLLGLLGVLCVPIGLSGALLPMLFHHLRREMSTLGATAGRLYGWVSLGALLGALFASHVLLLWLDLQQVYGLALLALLLVASILSVIVLRVSAVTLVLVVLLPALVGLTTLPSWDMRRLDSGAYRQKTSLESSFLGPDAFFAQLDPPPIIFYEDDPSSTIAVSEFRNPDGRLDRDLLTNAEPDGKLILDYASMSLAGLIPALLAERVERCFVIGYGLGITVGELSALRDARLVQVAEASQGVIDAAPLFDEGNRNASKSPKVAIQHSDAYRLLLRSGGQWDVVVSEPSHPWMTGVERLYSVEFLQAVREHLAPGGVMAQRIDMSKIDETTLRIALRNYASVFPHVSVWFTMGDDMLLLGFDQPQRSAHLRTLEARFQRPDFAAGFERSGIESFAALLAHEHLPLDVPGTLQAMEPLHTLRHPSLGYHAARAFFVGESTPIPKPVRPRSVAIGARNSLLRRFAARDGSLTEAALAAAAQEACRMFRGVECATLFARWQRDAPDSPRLANALQQARRTARAERSMRGRDLAQKLSPQALGPLVALYGGDVPLPGSPISQAARLSEEYANAFQYAVPFERSVLEAAWSRCTTLRCAWAKRTAETRLGPLGPPVATGDEP